MFIELHIIQNFAPANLNRDDTNNPKDCEFGGVRRARISSQCIKRAIRLHPVFSESTQAETGKRTRWITRLLKRKLMEAGKDETQAQQAAEAFAARYSKMDRGHTSVLLYLSPGEIETICQALLENWEDVLNAGEKNTALDNLVKDIVRQTKDRTSAPDIALFGRMLAEKPELNLDAACQVAHAISTHRATMEIDFFTAVDDLSSDEETGAGMMGVTGFNSACFYRYACLDWEQLLKNLNGDAALAKRTVEGFLRASLLATPSGKQNSFAAQNPPSFALAVIRNDGMCWSLANAFENPVSPGREGLIRNSVAALDRYWGQLNALYGNGKTSTAVISLVEAADFPNLAGSKVENMEGWVAAVLKNVPEG